MRIWKYEIPLPGCLILLPERAKIVHVGEQEGKIFAWVLRTAQEVEEISVCFLVFGTGHNIPDNATHIGTVQMRNGQVWHVFKE